MCGIYAYITIEKEHQIPPRTLEGIQRRGPDHIETLVLESQNSDYKVNLTSSVLVLRGTEVTPQPIYCPDTTLAWNGEAWKIHGQPVLGNDTVAVFDMISKATTHDEILDALRVIEGPFALVALCKRGDVERLYYTRDRLGRRSLVYRKDENNGSMAISSIADGKGVTEVEAGKIHWLEFGPGKTISSVDWVPKYPSITNMVSSLGSFNLMVPTATPNPAIMYQSAATLQGLLRRSLELRALNIFTPPTQSPDDSPVAVLFSGGLDCTVIARMLSDLLPADMPIDLVNVAFENPRIVAQFAKEKKEVASIYEECPDRITGRKSFAELKTVCSQRKWRFIAVNVPFKETEEHRQEVISLMAPHNTKMDISIAYALYFASRGQGLAHCWAADGSEIYEKCTVTSAARVLFSGLGADELFGGYIRHATAFSRRGYEGLTEELMLDVSRIGQRNLGRDDRVLSHWGREVRFPFLDEDVVKWAIAAGVEEKCDFDVADEEYGGIEGAKRVLRVVADGLGMAGAAKEKKRAIQFGARTAKMQSGKSKGTDVL